jgi:hypothetical protein
MTSLFRIRDLPQIKDLTDEYVDLTVTFELENGDDVDGPAVRFYLR